MTTSVCNSKVNPSIHLCVLDMGISVCAVYLFKRVQQTLILPVTSRFVFWGVGNR